MTPFGRRRLRERESNRPAVFGDVGRVSEGQMSKMCLWPAGNHGNDLLSEAIADVRPLLTDGSTKERIRLLWAAAKNAGELVATDVLQDTFMTLAVEVGLIDGRGCWTGSDVAGHVRRHGAEELAHLIAWALHGWNPFETGPLK
jgi:hypothetical protein